MVYKQALQNMNLAQYDERRRERESRMQQLQAYMLERKQNQDAEAQRGRAAESQKVRMLENASKIAKKEFDERMAEKQRQRRAEAEEEAKRLHDKDELNPSEHSDEDAGTSGEMHCDEASSIDDVYGGSDVEDDYDDEAGHGEGFPWAFAPQPLDSLPVSWVVAWVVKWLPVAAWACSG